MPKNTNILMIRHAEKPAAKNDPMLTVPGQERAQAYIVYFQNLTINGQPLKLNYLFAAKNSSASHRPYLTIAPLAQAIKLPINDKHKDKDYQQVADDILQNKKYNNANILICWHHGELLKLAGKLGAPKSALPSNWPADVYGWLLQLSFDANGILTVAPTVNQQLMYDDYGKNPPTGTTV